MSAYFNRNILKDLTAQTIGNSSSATISEIHQLSGLDSRDLYVIAEISDVSGTAATVKVQHCHRKDGTFTDVSGATVTIDSSDGTYNIAWNEVDGGAAAMLPFIQIVGTCGGSDEMTINRLYVTRRLD